MSVVCWTIVLAAGVTAAATLVSQHEVSNPILTSIDQRAIHLSSQHGSRYQQDLDGFQRWIRGADVSHKPFEPHFKHVYGGIRPKLAIRALRTGSNTSKKDSKLNGKISRPQASGKQGSNINATRSLERRGNILGYPSSQESSRQGQETQQARQQAIQFSQGSRRHSGDQIVASEPQRRRAPKRSTNQSSELRRGRSPGPRADIDRKPRPKAISELPPTSEQRTKVSQRTQRSQSEDPSLTRRPSIVQMSAHDGAFLEKHAGGQRINQEAWSRRTRRNKELSLYGHSRRVSSSVYGACEGDHVWCAMRLGPGGYGHMSWQADGQEGQISKLGYQDESYYKRLITTSIGKPVSLFATVKGPGSLNMLVGRKNMDMAIEQARYKRRIEDPQSVEHSI